MNKLIDYVIGHSLFHKDVDNLSSIMKEIPDEDLFGVFVGIERSPITEWPHDVHGCIGYWDRNYQKLSKDAILQHLLDVGYSSTWNDDRRKYFDHPLADDLKAKYKLYFMLLPVYEVKLDGKIKDLEMDFNNRDYGLIVENGGIATYLPDVFPDKNFDEIKESLIHKSGSYLNQRHRFYAYRTIIIKKSIVNYLIYKIVQNQLQDYVVQPIIDFFNNHYGSFIPYMVLVNGTIIRDKKHDVRNIATMGDIIKFKDTYTITCLGVIKSNLEYYLDQELSNQALAFMVKNLYMLGIKQSQQKRICDQLYSYLPNLEDRDFEWGEIISALTFVDPRTDVIDHELSQMYQYEKDKIVTINSIFRYNWFINAMVNVKNSNVALLDLLYHRVVHYIRTFGYQVRETNYYAVLLESLSGLYRKTGLAELKVMMSEILFFLLQKRKNGLFIFNDGSARLDISGHILNALYNLSQS